MKNNCVEKSVPGILSVSVDHGFRAGRVTTTGRARLVVPASVAEVAGVGLDVAFAAAKDGDRRVLLRPSKGRGGGYIPPFPSAAGDHLVFEFVSTRAGMPAVAFPETPCRLRITEGGLLLDVPDSMPESAAAADRRRVEAMAARQAATFGLYGAAYAVALDVTRNGGRAHRIGMGQLEDMLRNAGHRLERVSHPLWRLDGATVSLPDLYERARRIDREAVLVAVAA